MLLLLLAFDALAAGDSTGVTRWNRLGISFEARTEVFRSSQSQLLSASTEIAYAITNLQEEHLNAVHDTFLKDHALVILFEKNSGTDAMFFPPKTLRPDSEEWIISLSPGLLSSPTYLRIVAHEYFHAVHFALNPGELDWIREGLAQLFEHIVFGGFNAAHVHASLTNSDYGLEETFDPNSYSPEKYGNTLLYFYYINTQCSLNNALFWNQIRASSPGRSGISNTLSKLASPLAHCRNFETSAAAFSVARLVNAFSGFEQSSATSILNTDKRLSIDPTFERRLIANPLEYWRRLKHWRPIRITSPTALIIAPSSPIDIRWLGLERAYPYRVRELGSRDLRGLGPKWDVGLFRAD